MGVNYFYNRGGAIFFDAMLGAPHFVSPIFNELNTGFIKLVKGEVFKNFFPIELLFFKSFLHYRRVLKELIRLELLN